MTCSNLYNQQHNLDARECDKNLPPTARIPLPPPPPPKRQSPPVNSAGGVQLRDIIGMFQSHFDENTQQYFIKEHDNSEECYVIGIEHLERPRVDWIPDDLPKHCLIVDNDKLEKSLANLKNMLLQDADPHDYQTSHVFNIIYDIINQATVATNEGQSRESEKKTVEHKSDSITIKNKNGTETEVVLLADNEELVPKNSISDFSSTNEITGK